MSEREAEGPGAWEIGRQGRRQAAGSECKTLSGMRRALGVAGDRQVAANVKLQRRRGAGARGEASEELDPCSVSARGCEGCVPCHEGSRQSFRECEVCRIVRRDGVPELPDPGEQHVVRIATQGQRGEVLKRLGASRGVEFGGERVSAEDLGHFEIQQVGSVQRLSVGKEAIGRPDAGRRIQQYLDHSRGVDHDHRCSRSALTALAGGTRVMTGARWAIRFRNSATVGRSAARRTSASR